VNRKKLQAIGVFVLAARHLTDDPRGERAPGWLKALDAVADLLGDLRLPPERIPTAKQFLNTTEVAELKDDLDKLAGRGKHDSPANFCYLDGYFAKHLEQKYGGSIEELEAFVKKANRSGGR
jgi:hypothetical protein